MMIGNVVQCVLSIFLAFSVLISGSSPWWQVGYNPHISLEGLTYPFSVVERRVSGLAIGSAIRGSGGRQKECRLPMVEAGNNRVNFSCQEFARLPAENLRTNNYRFPFSLNQVLLSRILQIDIPEPLLSDGQFVWGPNVGDFIVSQYLEGYSSGLAAYADHIELWASYTSVNPKVLLAVLELQYGYVNSLPTDHIPEAVTGAIEKTALDLALAFYEHLYTWGSRRSSKEARIQGTEEPVVLFADGTTAN